MRKIIALFAVLLSVSVLTAGESEKAVQKDVFDSRIEGWAYGQVWGLNVDQGILSINGQLSKEAIEFAKRVESTLKDGAGHDPAQFAELQGKMEKLDKRQIHFNYDKAAPAALMQCPVKMAPAKESGRVLLTDLKVGDTVLIGFNASASANRLYTIVLLDTAAPTTPATSTSQQK